MILNVNILILMVRTLTHLTSSHVRPRMQLEYGLIFGHLLKQLYVFWMVIFRSYVG